MSSYIQLQATERLNDRAFTHPEHSDDDLAALRHMALVLRERVVCLPRIPWMQRHPLICYQREASGCRHRLVVVDAGDLLHGRGFTVVGFFGHRRENADAALLGGIDNELMREVLDHPLLLSYSSLELANGNWGNMVLLRHPEGIDSWQSGARHAYAAHMLAPSYYEGIRLHNGILPEGLHAIEQLRVTRTKYYDYRHATPWRGLREQPL